MSLKLIILGCGTSLHAGLIGAEYFKDLCNFFSVQVFDGAEFNISDIPKVIPAKKDLKNNFPIVNANIETTPAITPNIPNKVLKNISLSTNSNATLIAIKAPPSL